jgi:ABC-type branched-subunit amino acid transport system substrate-binding protein
LGLAVSALALTGLPAAAQTKVTNEGISATEIVIGTHQDLSGPIKVWGVPVSNGMKMATEEINAAGGIHGRKIKLILEDSGYDPKRAVLASQKMVERDKVFAMVGPMGSPTVLASQDVLFDAGVPQALFPTRAAGGLNPGQVFAVTKDGKRFLVNTRPGESNVAPLTVVIDWTATIQK